MMEVLKNRGVKNCCVVVTRYFGGVLLGAGGLVRAYTKGCAIALDAAQVVRMQLFPQFGETLEAFPGKPACQGQQSAGAGHPPSQPSAPQRQQNLVWKR